MSCRATSRDAFDRTIPVIPPIVKSMMKPSAQRRAGANVGRPPWRVATHLNTLMPVGTAIIMVADEKYARVSTSNPTVNIWCAQTINPRKPIASMA